MKRKHGISKPLNEWEATPEEYMKLGILNDYLLEEVNDHEL